MDTSQPGPIMMLVGGIVMAVSTVLDWSSGGDTIGLSLDTLGLFGIFVLLVGLAVAGYGAVRVFGLSISLPEEVLGLTIAQMLMVDAFVVFLWTFSHVASDFLGGGLHLAWIAAAVATVGAALTSRSASASLNQGETS